MKSLRTSVWLPALIVGAAVLLGALSTVWQVSAAETSAKATTVAVASSTEDGGSFTAFVPVLRHPRCMNCHSRGDFPRQGDDGHPHSMNVRRGPDGNGVTSQKCSTCHQDHNLAGAHMPPGAPGWALPPANTPMILQGLSDAQICRSIKNPKENNDRSIDQIVEHLSEDELVSWAWNPGEGRTPIPMSRTEFVSKVKEWQAAGAPCPTDVSQKAKP